MATQQPSDYIIGFPLNCLECPSHDFQGYYTYFKSHMYFDMVVNKPNLTSKQLVNNIIPSVRFILSLKDFRAKKFKKNC